MAGLPFTQASGSPVHDYYQELLQINNGLMNKFVAWDFSPGSDTQGERQQLRTECQCVEP